MFTLTLTVVDHLFVLTSYTVIMSHLTVYIISTCGGAL